MPVFAPEVVVDTEVTKFESVLYANPVCEASDPPVERMEPFKVAVVVEILVVEFVENQATVEGVIEFEAVEVAPVPAIFVAVTVKVYD